MRLPLTILILFVVISSGCLHLGKSSNQTDKEFPLTFTDPQGRNLSIKAYPKRIISLAPGNTEILFALGLGDKVVGVTEYDNYPPETSEIEKVGGFTDVNVEKVVSLNPDLILAVGGAQLEIVEKLEDLGLMVVVVDSKNIDDILNNIVFIGKITGSEKMGESVTEDLQNRITSIVENVGPENRPSAMYIVWADPIMVAGPDSFQGDMIEMAGGENIFSDAPIQYPSVSLERVIERDPEVIITSEHTGINLSTLYIDPKWSEIRAVKNNRLHTINADVVSRPGPRIVEALELFSRWLENTREG